MLDKFFRIVYSITRIYFRGISMNSDDGSSTARPENRKKEAQRHNRIGYVFLRYN